MKTYKLIFTLIAIFTALLFPIAAQAQSSSEIRVLAIGNDTYEYNSDLSGYAKSSADYVGRAFSHIADTAHVRYNVKSDYDVVRLIAYAFSDAGPEDISIFFFSGHSDIDRPSYDQHGILGLGLSSDLGGFNQKQLKKELDKIQGKKIVIIESCFSGDFIGIGHTENRIAWEKENKPWPWAFQLSENRGAFLDEDYYVITSSDTYTNSYVSDLASALHSGLKNRNSPAADINGDHKVMFSEIYSHLCKTMRYTTPEYHMGGADFPIYSK